MLEINKIAAALLIGALLYKGVSILAETVFHKEELIAKAYVVEGVTVEEPAVEVREEPAEADVGPDFSMLLAAATPEQGQRLYKRCQTCHDVAKDGKHKIGPNLYGVVGAAVGRHDDFKYSGALSDHGGIWSVELLDAYLTSPRAAIPGNKMTFNGIDRPAERAALIVYLNGFSDSPDDLTGGAE